MDIQTQVSQAVSHFAGQALMQLVIGLAIVGVPSLILVLVGRAMKAHEQAKKTGTENGNATNGV